MKLIKDLVDGICEELEGAENYAECAIERKAHGDATWGDRFKEMANQELQHSSYLHELAEKAIELLRKVYVPPEDMLRKWEQSHSEYIGREATIKQMLAII